MKKVSSIIFIVSYLHASTHIALGHPDPVLPIPSPSHNHDHDFPLDDSDHDPEDHGHFDNFVQINNVSLLHSLPESHGGLPSVASEIAEATLTAVVLVDHPPPQAPLLLTTQSLLL